MKKLIILAVVWPPLALAQNKQMAITVDDLPAHLERHDSATLVWMNEQIIAHLLAADAQATGFVNEAKLFQNNRLVEYKLDMLGRWTESGLELGNHTFSHQDYNELSPAQFFEIIEKGERFSRSLMEKAGKDYVYFRHPYLHRGNSPEKVKALEDYLQSRGYTEAPVTIDNSEWIFANAFDRAFREKNEEQMARVGEAYVSYMLEKALFYESLAQELFGRKIAHVLLIHANLLNAWYLDELLAAHKNIGYSFPSLAEVLKDPAYLSKDTFAGNAGISWVDRWALSQGKTKEFFANDPRCPQFILEYSRLTE